MIRGGSGMGIAAEAVDAVLCPCVSHHSSPLVGGHCVPVSLTILVVLQALLQVSMLGADASGAALSQWQTAIRGYSRASLLLWWDNLGHSLYCLPEHPDGIDPALPLAIIYSATLPCLTSFPSQPHFSFLHQCLLASPPKKYLNSNLCLRVCF